MRAYFVSWMYCFVIITLQSLLSIHYMQIIESYLCLKLLLLLLPTNGQPRANGQLSNSEQLSWLAVDKVTRTRDFIWRVRGPGMLWSGTVCVECYSCFNKNKNTPVKTVGLKIGTKLYMKNCNCNFKDIVLSYLVLSVLFTTAVTHL